MSITLNTAGTDRKCYKVYLFGQYVGTLILTPADVRKITADAVYLLKPSHWIETRD